MVDSASFLRRHELENEEMKDLPTEEVPSKESHSGMKRGVTSIVPDRHFGLNENYIVPITAETEVIQRLKQDLLDFLAKQIVVLAGDHNNPKANFDNMTFELVKMAGKMTKFDLFGAACSHFDTGHCILSPKNPLFQYCDMDLARLLVILAKILLSDDSHQARIAVMSPKARPYPFRSGNPKPGPTTPS